MEVTEKWLGDIGGWQAMKAAREYVRTGQVANATRDGIIFKGDVGLGQRALRATLVAAGGMRTEAKCGCNDARRGLICSHAIAVALSIISPHLVGKRPEPVAAAGQGGAAGSVPGLSPATGTSPGSRAPGAAAPAEPAKPARPELSEEDVPAGTYTVHISTPHFTQLTGSKTASVPVTIQFNPDADGPRDLPVAKWLHDHQLPLGQTAPQHLRLPADDLSDLLEALIDHPDVHPTLPSGAGVNKPATVASTAKTSDVLSINKDKLIISSAARWILHSEVDKLRQFVVFQLSDAGHTLLTLGETLWLYDSGANALQAVPHVPEALRPMWSTLITGAPVRQPIAWVASHLTAISELFELPPGPDSAENIRLIPANPRFQCRLDGSQRQLTAQVSLLHPHYDASRHAGVSPQETPPPSDATYPIQDQQNTLVFYTRNFPVEFGLQRQFQSTGFLATNVPNHFEMKGEREVLHFLSSDLQKLRRRFEVTEADGFRNLISNFEIIRPHIKVPRKPLAPTQTASGPAPLGASTSQDWLSLEVAYEASDGFHIPRQDVLRLIRSGKRDYQGRDGKRYLIDVDSCEELESTLQDVNTRFTGGNHVAIRSRQVEALEAFLPAGSPVLLDPVPFLEEGVIRSRLGRFGEMLRPYQLEGVRWLERHSRSGGGGLLADEMGLGKTVQTLALLKLILAARAGDPTLGPAVVVCPTSLLGNWSDEAARFTPELKTHISHDSKRFAALRKLAEFDVIFTSYALIQRDLDYYRDIRFAAIVLDEASYIRNPETESARAVRQLDAASRFSLTGTPVENSVKDLWSIFSFTLPGYLPIYDDFNERFVKPLAKAAAAESGNAAPTYTPMRSRAGAGAAFGPSAPTAESTESGSTKSPSAVIMERLRRLIRPHILRRTKREVAKDLPEKIEKVLWCELTAAQSTVYHRLLEEGREEIRVARQRSGQGGSRMTMFTVLLRLRQVCNDLSLLGIKAVPKAGAAAAAPAEVVEAPATKGGKAKKSAATAKPKAPNLSSGKLPVYEELLQESIEGGHKTLIFSQFVGMLKLLKSHAEAEGIPHCYLDGSSTDRPAQVASFQTDPNKKLFFISLKAGGYGLNLTAADEVVLVDPWWNPAVEAQAIDRAHRIGQGRPVTAYRLVCRGTVEEKILALQQKKRAVMDMALEDDAAIFAGVTDEELDELLA
ncbi:SNF2 family DNA or RNA helicase [Roseimicrobium gellanilyticum]|uniref:SNF2 family DNA or RNA helicase n=1 Tax=Roseimicrobium gellanilyticum TaxID=748857 RepID=A0A366HTH8_9BACT|nr:DEAD/DEAH box helicase [Roseimicrobium gellanilyticum]RBP46398.1 SNF2 family DNA or RNA helicase [Roseimicrobium gellanilyticum]